MCLPIHSLCLNKDVIAHDGVESIKKKPKVNDTHPTVYEQSQMFGIVEKCLLTLYQQPQMVAILHTIYQTRLLSCYIQRYNVYCSVSIYFNFFKCYEETKNGL